MHCSVNGVPDITMAIEGVGIVFVEFKRSGDQSPRANQEYVIGKLRKAGVLTYVIHSWEEWMVMVNKLRNMRSH